MISAVARHHTRLKCIKWSNHWVTKLFSTAQSKTSCSPNEVFTWIVQLFKSLCQPDQLSSKQVEAMRPVVRWLDTFQSSIVSGYRTNHSCHTACLISKFCPKVIGLILHIERTLLPVKVPYHVVYSFGRNRRCFEVRCWEVVVSSLWCSVMEYMFRKFSEKTVEQIVSTLLILTENWTVCTV